MKVLAALLLIFCATTEADTLIHDGLIRTYQVHTPTGYSKEVPLPVVMYLHGGSGNATSAVADGIPSFADKHNFILVAPEGTGEIDRGVLRASWNGGKWAGGQCCGVADDVGFIAAMLDKLKVDYNIDSKRVYAMGISNGGLMANRLGCELSDRITAIATVAPTAVMSPCVPKRPVPVLNVHGKRDKCNNYDTGLATFTPCVNVPYTRMTSAQVMSVWRAVNACTTTTTQGYKLNDASCIVNDQCAAPVEMCTVERMGHTWPSGSQYLPAFMIGPVTYNLSTDQIWTFFKKYSL